MICRSYSVMLGPWPIFSETTPNRCLRVCACCFAWRHAASTARCARAEGTVVGEAYQEDSERRRRDLSATYCNPLTNQSQPGDSLGESGLLLLAGRPRCRLPRGACRVRRHYPAGPIRRSCLLGGVPWI